MYVLDALYLAIVVPHKLTVIAKIYQCLFRSIVAVL